MPSPPFRYFMLHKIRGMVSQFISTHSLPLLDKVDFAFPEGIHAIGRLDKESEGLLLLTTNKKITSLLFQGKNPHTRTYLVQVKHCMKEENLSHLRNGIIIRIKGGSYYTTPPCDVQRVEKPFHLMPLLDAPFVYDQSTWLLISLTEGKYHQVRKMVAAAGHRCLRLIRISIEDMHCKMLNPGGIQEFSEEEFFTLLHLDKS